VCELDAAVRACGPCVGDVLEAVSGIDGGTVGEFVRGGRDGHRGILKPSLPGYPFAPNRVDAGCAGRPLAARALHLPAAECLGAPADDRRQPLWHPALWGRGVTERLLRE
jgi:hypothetical protein